MSRILRKKTCPLLCTIKRPPALSDLMTAFPKPLSTCVIFFCLRNLSFVNLWLFVFLSFMAFVFILVRVFLVLLFLLDDDDELDPHEFELDLLALLPELFDFDFELRPDFLASTIAYWWRSIVAKKIMSSFVALILLTIRNPSRFCQTYYLAILQP